MSLGYMMIPGVPKQWTALDTVKSQKIMSAVCSFYGISETDIRKRSRLRVVVEPRQVAFYMLRRHTNLGVTGIGRLFSLDHTTIIYGSQNIKNLMFSDDDLREKVLAIENKILS